jgi:hypothetical protein
MELPDLQDLNQFNRILAAVKELSDDQDSCTIEAVIKLCSSFVFAGKPADHIKAIKLLKYSGFFKDNKSRIRITDLGNEFLAFNPKHHFEITENQKECFVEHLVFKGPWKSSFRGLFLRFSPNYSDITFELFINEDPLPIKFSSALHLLHVLNVISERKRQFIVVPKYVPHVRDLLSEEKTISEEELEQSLIAKRKLGYQAEEAIVRFERKRLKALGREVEAKSVRRISDLNVGAGYDIESFNGDSPSIEYDRFIEVKASNGAEVRFYFTSNEKRVAEEKGDEYWIYFAGSFTGKKGSRIKPIMIQNPAVSVFNNSNYDVSAAKYLVKEK